MLPVVMEGFLLYLEGENRNQKTISSYRKNLKSFLEGVFNGEEPSGEDYRNLDSSDFMKWIEQLKEEGLSPSSINQRMATMKKFFTYLMGMKIVNVNIPQTIGLIKSDTLFERVVLTETEVVSLVTTAKENREYTNSYSDYRDEMIVNLFLSTGLRIDELFNINVSDIDINSGKLSVIGKRNKKRTVFLPKSKLPMLEKYLEVRNSQKNGFDSALFLSRQKNENGYRLSKNQIRRIVVNLAKQANVSSITPHSLRHTGATLQIQKGADIMDVSKWLGHSSVAITEKIYVHQTNESAQRVANIFDGIF